MDDSRPGLIPLAKVAVLLCVSRQTLYRHARTGEMPFVKIGGLWFMHEDELMKLMHP